MRQVCSSRLGTFHSNHTRFHCNSDGTVAILSSVSFAIFFACLAIAIDVGTLYSERRQAQGAVDLAAMAAAGDLDNASAAANATLVANGYRDTRVQVDLGSYQADPSIDDRSRFKAGVTPYNAARVTMVRPGRLYFAKAFTRQKFDIAVTGVAANGDLAAFSVGSRLASVRDGLVNSVLGSLLGSNVSLNVMDYNALVDAKVSLIPFLNALATRLHITAGTYSDVLQSSASITDVLAATAAITQQSAHPSATIALTTLLSQTGNSRATLPLSKIIDLGPLASVRIGQAVHGFDANFGVVEMISASSIVANGKNQVSVDLAVDIPGVISVKLDIAVGEPVQRSDWVAVGQPGSIVKTAQTRMRFTATIGGSGILAGAKIKLPIYLELASAQARLDSVTCQRHIALNVGIATTPGVAEVWIGDTSNDMRYFQAPMKVSPAQLISVTSLGSVVGSSHIFAGNLSETIVSFSQSEIDRGVVKTTDTRSLLESLATTAIGNINLQASIAGLGIGVPSQLTSAVASQLGSVARPLDEVIYNVITALGLHVGEADVQVEGVRCNGGGLLAG
jgi:uncharacterized membrane protein